MTKQLSLMLKEVRYAANNNSPGDVTFHATKELMAFIYEQYIKKESAVAVVSFVGQEDAQVDAAIVENKGEDIAPKKVTRKRRTKAEIAAAALASKVVDTSKELTPAPILITDPEPHLTLEYVAQQTEGGLGFSFPTRPTDKPRVGESVAKVEASKSSPITQAYIGKHGVAAQMNALNQYVKGNPSAAGVLSDASVSDVAVKSKLTHADVMKKIKEYVKPDTPGDIARQDTLLFVMKTKWNASFLKDVPLDALEEFKADIQAQMDSDKKVQV